MVRSFAYLVRLNTKTALDFIECFFAFLKGDARKGDPGTEAGVTFSIKS